MSRFGEIGEKMFGSRTGSPDRGVVLSVCTASCLLALILAPVARANLEITVLASDVDNAPLGDFPGAGDVDRNGNGIFDNGPITTGYRWLVEEDPTHNIVPGETCLNGAVADCASLDFHRSHATPVAKGDSSAALALIPSDRRYFVSVLPSADAGGGLLFAIGGAQVEIGQTSVEVLVQAEPIPLAQIRIQIYEDTSPINNAWDVPGENGLEGFEIILEEAGGKYGASGGFVFQDAFGNRIGTSYPCGDPSCPVAPAGPVLSGTDGVVTLKNLAPAKYGIKAVPPSTTAACPVGWSGPGTWQQTSTLEGTPTIDAWVKANEPPFFVEFGPPGPHVAIGFTRDCKKDSAFSGNASVSGQVHALHLSRLPEVTFQDGPTLDAFSTRCWVALNDMSIGRGQGIYAAPCDDASEFLIENLLPAPYQLAVFDSALDMIIGLHNFTIDAGGDCAEDTDPAPGCQLGNVTVFPWYARIENWVFLDSDGDGFWDNDPALDGYDESEIGILEQNINLRWRDGTIYQAFPTDLDGYVPFDRVFPFFSYLVAEVDFARYKATGATFVVDAGGVIPEDNGWANPSFDQLNPQPQFCTAADVAAGTIALNPDGVEGTEDDVLCALGDPIVNPNTGNNLSRTETGVVLTEGFQQFLGQTSVFQWGKQPYARDENGGISGIVFYAVTRAENDPQFAAAEQWEPGIPRLQVALYQDSDRDGVIDDLNNDGCPTPADVDNHPQGNFPGPEDFHWLDFGNCQFMDLVAVIPGAPFPFSPGDAIQISTTDSWDDSLPEGCQGEVFVVDSGEPFATPTDCFDGLRNFNQTRPAVFDGGYAFDSYFEGGMASGSPETDGLPSGTYIVETGTHRVYQTLKEEDRNVDFGDEFQISELLLPPPCVGNDHLVPATLSMFPEAAVDGEFAGQMRPLCDRKQVAVASGRNAAADFFMFTEVPIAGHITGFILDDLTNEFDPNSPSFGEKFAPPFMPISVRDWTGEEIIRTYSDRWGTYDLLVPSTFNANLPMPSGMGPNMLTTCMNSPGPIPNPDHDPLACLVDGPLPGDPCVTPNPSYDPRSEITDPFFRRNYSQFCYQFQYMPGSTTYLDTPVVPIAAFAGPDQFPVDCEYADGTPTIWTVSGRGNGIGGGPWTSKTGNGGAHRGFEIASAGSLPVSNPDWDGVDPAQQTILRDYGFGDCTQANPNDCGDVFVVQESGSTLQLDILEWTAGVVRTLNNIPLSAQSGTLLVTRADTGATSEMGVSVYFEQESPVTTVRTVGPGGSINDAIDVAAPGDVILVSPGTYEELVIMWKPVKLQGWGAFATTINAVKAPSEKIVFWRNRIEELIQNDVDLLPAQETNVPGDIEPALLFTEEGPGIIVLAKDNGPTAAVLPGFGLVGGRRNARIDGLGVTGADNGGGIFVNAYARYLEIGNNRIFGNSGNFGGGIRIGHPTLLDTVTVPDGPNFNVYTDGQNDNVRIHHNQVTQNGGLGGYGGGISLNHGADRYLISDNLVCGNFTQGEGAGIGHVGFNDLGFIDGNDVIFNQQFSQGLTGSGGGIFIGGGVPLVPTGGVCALDGDVTCTLDSECPGIDVCGSDSLCSYLGNACATDADCAGANSCNVPPPTGRDLLSPGSGRVVVNNNLIQGNYDGSGDGGGIRLSQINGQEVFDNTGICLVPFGQPCVLNSQCGGGFFQVCIGGNIALATWNTVDLLNNTIVNNVAGLAGGGVSMQDAVAVRMVNNTIVNNDSTATAGVAFAPGSPNTSTAQPSGVVSRQHSPALLDAIPVSATDRRLSTYSNPAMENNIIRRNRSFHFETTGPTTFGLVPEITGIADEEYWDLAVLGVPGGACFDPRASLLDAAISGQPGVPCSYHSSNTLAPVNPPDLFAAEYVNQGRGQTIHQLEPGTGLSVQPAFDEGGNFIDVRFGPLKPGGDYHLCGALALNRGSRNLIPGNGSASGGLGCAVGLLSSLCYDRDGERRFGGGSSGGNLLPDIGSDEDYALQTCAAGPAPAPSAVSRELGNRLSGKGSDLPSSGGSTGSSGSDMIAPRTGKGRRGRILLDPVDDAEPPITTTNPGDIGSTDPDSIAMLAAPTANRAPGNCLGVNPATNQPYPPGSKCMHLSAGDGFITMADGRELYMFSFRDVTGFDTQGVFDEGFLGAEASAPTISVDEGDNLYLRLTNVGMAIRPDLFDPHTVHYHGFANAASWYDGVPDTSVSVNMLSSLDYYYKNPEPGTFIYHCHVEATEHLQMGMIGNLWVRPAQNKTGYGGNPATIALLGGGTDAAAPLGYVYNDGDGSTAYDVETPIQVTAYDPDFHQASQDVQPLPFARMDDRYWMINGRGYPDTVNPANLSSVQNGGKESQRVSSLVVASEGDRILLRVTNLSVTGEVTLATTLGVPMRVVGKDSRLLTEARNTNTVLINPGETQDVIVNTAGVAPGTYFLYSTNLNYLNNDTDDLGGVMTEIVIEPAP